MRYLAGAKLNFVNTAWKITSTSENALFPKGNLGDGSLENMFMFNANGADLVITLDLAFWDGALGSWVAGVPAGWTKVVSGTGTVVETVVGAEVRSGSAAKMNKGNGTAQLVRDHYVRSGQQLVFEGFPRIAAAGSARASIYNPITRKYLNSAGGWQAAIAYVATEAASAVYVQKLRPFQVESWDLCQSSQVPLRITLEDAGAGGAGDFSFWDDVNLWPSPWNFAAVLGHNFDVGMLPELRSSDNDFAAELLEATMAVKQPFFWSHLATPAAHRYARLKLPGTNSATPYLFELVLGYAETALRGPSRSGGSVDVKLRRDVAQLREGSYAFPLKQAEETGAKMRFVHPTEQSLQEAYNEIYRRCRGGAEPLLVIPMSKRAELLYGRIAPSWENSFVTSEGAAEAELEVEPFPMPAVVT